MARYIAFSQRQPGTGNAVQFHSPRRRIRSLPPTGFSYSSRKLPARPIPALATNSVLQKISSRQSRPVQLAAAIEERLGILESDGCWKTRQTLGELRGLISGGTAGVDSSTAADSPAPGGSVPLTFAAPVSSSAALSSPSQGRHYIYSQWPWLRPVHWIRAAFIETIMRPWSGCSLHRAWFAAASRFLTAPC